MFKLMKIILSIKVVFLLFFLVFTGSSMAANKSTGDSPQVLRGSWFYHWGDLAKEPESGQWRYNQAQWEAVEFPENMPERQDNKIVWVKIDLPSGNWRDPYFFINAVDLAFEVFHNHKIIYYFGDIDEQGNSRFEGWPWHAFLLPNDYDQHTLYFRIASDYPSIGLSGEASIGNRFSLLNKVYGNGIAGLSFILVMLLVGVISTVMGLIKKDRAVAISTGILSFNLAIMMFSENELSQVILFEPLLWRYIAAFCYFLIPAFLSIIILAWLREKPPMIARVVLGITIAFVVGVAALSIFTTFNFVNAYPYFDGLFIILVMALLWGCRKLFYQQGITGRLMTFGILALFISLLLDMLSSHGFINWIGRTGQWGLLLFTMASLLIYLVQDWQQLIALNNLTQELESKVQVRTAELQASQNKLEKLAREDYLTGILNRRAFTERAIDEVANAIRFKRPISLLLFDLDHFKDVNDKYGHAVGDLVLKSVAAVSKDTCRDGELVCRFGGEEFVILLHATEASFAQSLAERLRQALKEIEVEADRQVIKIAASFGLISLNTAEPSKASAEQVVERLLAKADKMMYEVKVSGRDGLKTLEIMLNQLS
jgi:diguanylate cyclase (GGDEF)-like protein